MWNPQADSDVVMASPLGRAYAESAFHYLLDLERARAERAQRRLRLLLVRMQGPAGPAGQGHRFPPAVTPRVFEGLWRAVRDTDVVGWYREERVAGALLAECPRQALPAGHAEAIERRVAAVLRDQVPSSFAARLHVRIVEVGPRGRRH